MAPARVSVVIASTRPTRIGHHVAAWVLAALDDLHGLGADVTVHDLREIALPFLDEPGQPADGDYVHDHTRRWSAAMSATDALVLVMPEYNRGYNAALKNAIDYLYAEWQGLPVGCVGYGWHGASYAKAALRQTLERVRMTVVDGPGLEFGTTLTQEGEIRADEAAQESLVTMLTELVERARTPRPAG
jgi:NAD(P)H-dependent FMN reductase